MTTEDLVPNTYELVGGPECGANFELPSNHEADVFTVPYERIIKGIVHKFGAVYMKRTDGKAQYKNG